MGWNQTTSQRTKYFGRPSAVYVVKDLNPARVNDLDTHEMIQPGEIEALTAAEVATAIKQLKSGKAAGGDEIRPEMLDH